MASRRPAEEPPAKLTLAYLRKYLDRPGNGNADIYWIRSDFIETLRPE